jgi:hypothetical protein
VGATSWTMTGNTAATTVGVDVLLPPGANSVMLLQGDSVGAIPGLSPTVTVQGRESTALYYTGPASVNGVEWTGDECVACVVSSAADQHLNVRVSYPGGIGANVITWRVVASYATQAVQVEGAGVGASPVVVQGSPGSGSAPVQVGPAIGATGNQIPLGVIDGMPPPPTVSLQVAHLNITALALNTSATVIPDPGGALQVHIFDYAFDFSFNAFPPAGSINPQLTLQDSSGAVQLRTGQIIVTVTAPINFAAGPYTMAGNLMGLAPLPVGLGLVVRSGGAATSVLACGHVVYAVY